ncbi:MAG TPA: PA14 domain-containing protein [Candidatus Krumholzibacteria bacterium]|nr:PA14 domain-containing protein [Candidatus Krumholzibacteria bacterium]
MTRALRIVSMVALVCAAPVAHAQVSVSPQPTSGSVNQTVLVDVVLTNPGAAPVDAFGFRLSYPEALLAYQSVSVAGTLTDGWIAVSGAETTPGVVQVGGFHTTPTTAGGVLVRVAFLVETNLLTSGAIALSNFVDDITAATTTPATFQVVVAPGGAGLLGEYYNNIDFTGTLLRRVDATVNFDWALGSPDPSMGTNDFSIRWTGYVDPAFTQTYTFYTITDDGVRLWVNDQLIIDYWIPQAAIERSGSIALTAGVPASIRMEMFEEAGEAVAQLSWSSPSQGKQIIPSNRLIASLCAQGIGDVDATGLLDASDVACAFDMFLSGQAVLPGCDSPSTTCELSAADVNCSGAVTPADARAIEIRAAASLAPAPCFAPPDPVPSPPHELGLVQYIVDDGGTPRLQVLLVVEDASDLDAFGARLSFPASELVFNRVEPGYLTAGWHSIDGRSVAVGQIVLGGFDPTMTAPPGTADVCRIFFDFVGSPATVTGLVLSNFVDDFTGATMGAVTDVEPQVGIHSLHPNYPNPFNPSTHVRYDVGGRPGEHVRVRIAIYDVRGALVRSLVDADRVSGSYLATWDGLADTGAQAASGVYFCSMRAGDFVASRRMVLLK